jgi:hypothetical protein
MNALPKKMALMKGWMEDCSVERRSQTVPICWMLGGRIETAGVNLPLSRALYTLQCECRTQ